MENETTFDLGSLMKNEREARGWSFAKFSDETEKYGHRLSESYLYRLESGKKKNPTTQSLKVIMQTLNLSLDEVLKCLGMDAFLDKENMQTVELNEFVFPEDLFRFNVVRRTDNGKETITNAQKSLLRELIDDWYSITEHADPTRFNDTFEKYCLRLGELLEKERNLIEIKKEDLQMTFNVDVMLNKYGMSKNDIQSELKKLNIVALYNSKSSSIPLNLMGDTWMTNKEDNEIVIIDKISEIANSYITD
ncbi:XRE family transcriptional regulator [Robertmurraya yapensis]|uniref:XRE family transcriptional regulator n=1 Tax=Bacillus yapensis TaxID=2492960 RepID=A0A431VSV2_9BACI|nr:helix-turn-helix transcriptional regulator [Bacillus yapensis]RTR26285.1 XRE family transcriptional regulator [Bacillus yapensis]TKS93640.1 helix-turn-helix domain-containing protein [Bacillus yapensis]